MSFVPHMEVPEEERRGEEERKRGGGERREGGMKEREEGTEEGNEEERCITVVSHKYAPPHA